MKITNKHNVPESIFKWLKYSEYDGPEGNEPRTISATTLLKPVQEIVLTRKHYDEIETDAMDLYYSVLGSSVHASLEKLYEPTPRLTAQLGDWTISGKFDRINDRNEIEDWKVTSVWSWVYGSRTEDYRMQLSIYRWLYANQPDTWGLDDTLNNPPPVSSVGKIIFLFRDWNPKKVTGKYPPQPMMEMPLDLYTLQETEDWIVFQLKRIEAAERNEPVECAKDERWYSQRDDTYNKCAAYCDAAPFCPQWAADNGGK